MVLHARKLHVFSTVVFHCLQFKEGPNIHLANFSWSHCCGSVTLFGIHARLKTQTLIQGTENETPSLSFRLYCAQFYPFVIRSCSSSTGDANDYCWNVSKSGLQCINRCRRYFWLHACCLDSYNHQSYLLRRNWSGQCLCCSGQLPVTSRHGSSPQDWDLNDDSVCKNRKSREMISYFPARKTDSCQWFEFYSDSRASVCWHLCPQTPHHIFLCLLGKWRIALSCCDHSKHSASERLVNWCGGSWSLTIQL